ncbi:uncharacterized protein BDW47DRAFT_127861 [Aspergillus candidus]|uniref:Aconitase A/isopropylmalate dehydratase small subunit swivel domain-containing protein n=1 Tax=Aspergillus candidus TaxID=41067 RepID=A0A2I2F588_ASPCN|nr:hypothetical protein BDW47DRAFT_127861 [Aspergillus candidus]PLB35820.1 hypothetical protein BDW47DRAFT_127861 [Aspergillus candidus]
MPFLQPRRWQGKSKKLGEFIDTDAHQRNSSWTCKPNESSGQHCLQYTHPDFRHRASQGCDIVVAGKAFGCGPSREQAVTALLGLLGIVLQDESLYDAALDDRDISIDFATNVVSVGGRDFAFRLSRMEKALFEHGGIASAFRKFGKRLFEVMAAPRGGEG